MSICGCLNSSVDFPGSASSKETTCQCKRHKRHFPGSSDGKESTCDVGDLGLIPGWKDPLEKGTATHSSILTYKIPWIEETGRAQYMGLQRVGREWETFTTLKNSSVDFPGGTSSKAPTCQCKRHKRCRFKHCIEPGILHAWRRAWQPTPVFLPGEPHGERSLAG